MVLILSLELFEGSSQSWSSTGKGWGHGHQQARGGEGVGGMLSHILKRKDYLYILFS